MNTKGYGTYKWITKYQIKLLHLVNINLLYKDSTSRLPSSTKAPNNQDDYDLPSDLSSAVVIKRKSGNNTLDPTLIFEILPTFEDMILYNCENLQEYKIFEDMTNINNKIIIPPGYKSRYKTKNLEEYYQRVYNKLYVLKRKEIEEKTRKSMFA